MHNEMRLLDHGVILSIMQRSGDLEDLLQLTIADCGQPSDVFNAAERPQTSMLPVSCIIESGLVQASMSAMHPDSQQIRAMLRQPAQPAHHDQ